MYMYTGETVSQQVLQVLIPLMKELKSEIRCVKDDIRHLNESVSSLRETVINIEEHRNQTASELFGELRSLNESINRISNAVETQTVLDTHECAQLSTNTTGLYT